MNKASHAELMTFVRDFLTWMEPVSDTNEMTQEMVRRAKTLLDSDDMEQKEVL